jgi:GNAT superfamily N-acetyltransferase
MTSIPGIQFREATTADVAAMALCRLSDPTADPADPRMAAYFEREHHPQKALLPRIGFVALANKEVIGYIAGHRTTRHGCAGEIQYLYVTPAYRRRGIATELVRLVAEWFQKQVAQRICVAVAADSPKEAEPFFQSVGACPLKRNWYAWEDIGVVCRQ